MPLPAGFSNPLLVAIDRPDLASALALAEPLRAIAGGFKLGLELFVAEGPRAVDAFSRLGPPVFLDLKLHDIPNTVAAAVRSAARLGPALLTLHAAGGPAMLRAAAEAARAAGCGLRLLAVTVLTSLDRDDLEAIGVRAAPLEQVVRLARLAVACGIDGIVCSPSEVAAVRGALGPAPILVVPGIRPEGVATADQKRTADPRVATAAGADLLVVGRPITAAADPLAAARAILRELGIASGS
ncbi:MAG: orotidine-5'-phosphate decarboxylase [Geminicoccaceae bacterium]|nr:orotidine-5'-phosphate decarboxylase [Geminicoccaceae bacterium]MCS7268308.1 orotidine-5'-phosphate decarboxylase [Geminicoccaceae bacterium]MCX7629195.1 orotidine-5'-phosphate decarboxylase [Geminicoccaceae bacterium]MDW8125527.1 orotidine-5'-phosphate decarboxylase [Geminicoccaceae bacterium]MDW8341327.1 orotidine-5'-phosphate decarboxylase [Geminicoccaceae bacterium]